MNVLDFVNWIKREAQYGDATLKGASLTNDQPTLDILTSLNARRKRIWRKSDWDWSKEILAFAVTPGTVTYNVTAKSGNAIDRIINIIPNDSTASPAVAERPLVQKTERKFFEILYRYGASNPVTDGTFPQFYYNLGRTAAGVWQIRLFPGPPQAFTMGGSAKAILNTFLIGDLSGIAPFSPSNTGNIANPGLDYFPDGIVEDVLFDGVMADAMLCQGQKQDAGVFNSSFETKIKIMAAEEANAAKDNTPITSPLPELVRRRRRGGNRNEWRDRWWS